MPQLCSISRASRLARAGNGSSPLPIANSPRPSRRFSSVASAATPPGSSPAAGSTHRALPRSSIFDIPTSGTDGQPLKIRKWRRRQRADASAGVSLPLDRPSESGRRLNDDELVAAVNRYEWERRPQALLHEDGAVIWTRYRRRLAMRPDHDQAQDVWDQMLRSPKRQCIMTRSLPPNDFLVRLTPKIVYPNPSPDPLPATSSLNSSTISSTDSSSPNARPYLVLSPSRILLPRPPDPFSRSPSPSPLPSSSPSTSPPPDSKARSPTESHVKGRSIYAPLHSPSFSGITSPKGPHQAALARLPRGMVVPPYLPDQVEGQLRGRVGQELELLARRVAAQGLRFGMNVDKGVMEDGQGGGERPRGDGGVEGVEGVMRYLKQGEQKRMQGIALNTKAHDETDSNPWGSGWIQGRAGGQDARQREPRLGTASSGYDTRIVAILDVNGLDPMHQAKSGAGHQEAASQSVAPPRIPPLITFAPEFRDDPPASTRTSGMPIPTFHLASLFPPAQHPTLLSMLNRIIPPASPRSATQSAPEDSERAVDSAYTDDASLHSSHLIAVQIATSHPASSASVLIDAAVQTDVKQGGGDAFGAGDLAGRTRTRVGGTRGDVRGMPLVVALWRLSLWLGTGWQSTI